MTTAVSYSTVTLSHPDIGPIDHDPVCNETDLLGGGVGLQGSTRTKRTWTITCLTSSHAEIDALVALMGQRLTLTIDGTQYTGVMIRKPFVETQVTPENWGYTIGFVQGAASP